MSRPANVWLCIPMQKKQQFTSHIINNLLSLKETQKSLTRYVDQNDYFAAGCECFNPKDLELHDFMFGSRIYKIRRVTGGTGKVRGRLTVTRPLEGT